MKTIGFLISEKENEKRRPIVIEDIDKIDKKYKKFLFFQKGYGEIFGISDKELLEKECNVVNSEEILKYCDIICEPKIGDSDELSKIKNKIVFGWIHATQNKDITEKCIKNKLTVYAWEKMYYKNRHIFYKNNQIAGKSAVLHAMICFGKTFKGLNVAVLGNGNTAFGAVEILNNLGANVCVYNRKCEKRFIEEIGKYDVVVNCVLWDIMRKDHIIYKQDLRKMRNNAIIIDVSCDNNGAIESSIPTTIENPIYYYNGIGHYAVDHTPSLLYVDASKSISEEVIKYIRFLIEEKENLTLKNAKIIENGKILDNEILEFQNIETKK